MIKVIRDNAPAQNKMKKEVEKKERSQLETSRVGSNMSIEKRIREIQANRIKGR